MVPVRRLQYMVYTLLVVFCSTFFQIPVHANTAPKKANYFLKWSITDFEMQELAKWDLLILDMENQITNPSKLKKIRELNPDIMILAYITSQEIRVDARGGPGVMRDRLARGIPDAWYLTNSKNVPFSFWPGTHMLNVTNYAPVVEGRRFNEYLADFVASEVISSGLWDGVFYDNAWKDVSWFTGTDVDYDRSNSPDGSVDAKWYEGMVALYGHTRAKVASNIIIVGNGHTEGYVEALNGKMIENFEKHRWKDIMQTYALNQSAKHQPNVNIINSNTGNVENSYNYRAMRFGLTSALLEDGYYSFDYGDEDHARTWYYDEYDVSLGNALGKSSSRSGAADYTEDIWSRNFENGIAVVNSTNEVRTVSLNGEYEKIHGVQDSAVNDGSIVSEVTLAPKDGLILLKTFETLKKVVFTNGFFARFFKPTGERARNGMFVFEEGQEGGAQIAHLDLDFNNKEELIIVDNNKILAWRDDEQPLFKIYPYGANYTGSLQVAVGDLNNDGFYEIYVAPSAGFKEPIRAYNRHGDVVVSDFFPFGKNYKGGYHIALTKAVEKVPSRLIIGSGTGVAPTITLFEYRFKKLKSFTAFESGFRGGVSVAAGDLDGDGVQEIIAGKGQGGSPTVRVFSLDGKEKYKSFNAYTTLFKPGIDVRALDIDFDGVDEIMTLSESAL